MPPEEKKNLRAQIECLQRELCKEKIKVKWMKKETDAQSTVIAQLKKLLIMNQTKLVCSQGHRYCVIDHKKYNLVRTVKNRKNSEYKEKNKYTSSLLLHPMKLAKKIDQIQLKYSVPPSLRENLSDDGIHPEFSDVWKNVISFSQHVLEAPTSKFPFAQSYVKTRKPSYVHKSVILGSPRPYKFKIEKQARKPKAVKSNCHYEPMTDAQLAEALDISERELAEAFGCNGYDQVVPEAFNCEEEDIIDTDGLKLVDGYDIGKNEDELSRGDKSLAPAFGYFEESENSQNDRDLAAEFCYADADEHSQDD